MILRFALQAAVTVRSEAVWYNTQPIWRCCERSSALDTALIVGFLTVGNLTNFQLRIISERSTAWDTGAILISTSRSIRLTFSLSIRVIIFVTSGTYDSILAIGHTIFILNDTVTLKQAESISALYALSSFIGQAVGIDLHTKALLADCISLLALLAAIPSIW